MAGIKQITINKLRCYGGCNKAVTQRVTAEEWNDEYPADLIRYYCDDCYE